MKKNLAAMREYATRPGKPMTNYDQIKNFTLDEMAEFLHEHTGCACCSRQNYDMCLDVGDCKTHIKEWLESEV